MFNIVLFNPQIPQNTGNIGRLCVNAGSKLHIVKPIGFDISEKAVKRAGLDYWNKLNLTVWENYEEFFNKIDLEIEIFDLESLAVFRNFIGKKVVINNNDGQYIKDIRIKDYSFINCK